MMPGGGLARRDTTSRALITAAAAGYATNVAFGTAVATRVIDNSRIRWVHHALFIATATLTALGLTAGAIGRHPAGLTLVPAAGLLATLPYAGGGTRRHALVASLAAPAFATALALVWRRH
ncbi:hypothetical protein [Microbacterium sp.]|uniref:hypothetical protein n=1 Tax=Microbacterium sp. TaxID=51671 RepID=UPI003C754F22